MATESGSERRSDLFSDLVKNRRRKLESAHRYPSSQFQTTHVTMDSPSNPEAAIPPTLIRKALEFHTLIGISEHETRETVLTTLVETGFSDDSSQRTMDSLLDKVRTDPDDAINGFEKKGESEAVLSRALLHTLASARGQTSRANSLLESLSEKEFTPEHQQDITEALEAALHGLPVELVLSLRTIQTKPDESAVRRVLEFLKESQSQPNGAMSGKKVLQKQAVIGIYLFVELRMSFRDSRITIACSSSRQPSAHTSHGPGKRPEEHDPPSLLGSRPTKR